MNIVRSHLVHWHIMTSHKKSYTKRVDKCKKTLQGDQAMMHATCSEIASSNGYVHSATQGEGGVHASHSTGSRVSFQKNKAVELKPGIQAGLSCSEYCTRCPAATVMMAMQVKCVLARRKKLDRCLGNRVTATNAIKKCWTLPNVLPHHHNVKQHAKIEFFSYSPCTQQNGQWLYFQVVILSSMQL